ncbi:myosin-2 heavy chain-like [Acropora muricata]|uniref:myosin-2 heavy chain-like n=1 Tax=Acropora muricata TaxID=159855 RepID=UPI0010FCC055
MWSDSHNNGEPSQLSQASEVTYELFGVVKESLSQGNFDPFLEQNLQEKENYNSPCCVRSEAWPGMGCSLFVQGPKEDFSPPRSHVEADEQSSQESSPTYLSKSPVDNHQANVRSKSAVLNKIHHLESTSFAMNEEIQEQKQRNASLEKRIADGEEQFTQMNEQAASLKNQLQEMTDKHRKFEYKLDHQIQQLTEVIKEKKQNICEIKQDANMVQTLREDKDELRVEIEKLEQYLDDINLDIYWMDYRFMHDLDRMVIFPFWKLEEDLERALNGEDPTLYDEPGPPDREDDEGDGYDYDEDEVDDYEEEASTEDKKTYKSGERTFHNNSYQWSNATAMSDSCHSQGIETKVKSKSKLGKFLVNVFRGGNAAKKNKRNKGSKSRFVRWLTYAMSL